MTEILVAHAPAAKKRAAIVTEELAALGYKVEAAPIANLAPHPRKRLASAVSKASAVLVLWSKEAGFSPALLATAHRAQAAGKLALARLDAAKPPHRFAAAIDLSAWKGFAEAKAWKRLLANLPMAPAVHAAPKPKAPAKAQSPAADAPKKKNGAALWWTLGALGVAAGAAAAVYFTLFA